MRNDLMWLFRLRRWCDTGSCLSPNPSPKLIKGCCENLFKWMVAGRCGEKPCKPQLLLLCETTGPPSIQPILYQRPIAYSWQFWACEGTQSACCSAVELEKSDLSLETKAEGRGGQSISRLMQCVFVWLCDGTVYVVVRIGRLWVWVYSSL